MKKYLLFALFVAIGCTQKPAEVVHKRDGVYSPVYSEVYVESPDGKMARSLRGNNDSARAQEVSIINKNAIVENYGYHTVQSGESLWSISRKYGMTVPEVVSLNDMQQPYVIKPGQKIKVAGGSGSVTVSSVDEVRVSSRKVDSYTVKPGDTLSTIAEKFDMKTVELADMNNIDKPYSIRVGQKLRVSGSAVAASKSEDTPKTTSGIYVVKSGDNLSSIASRHNMSLGELAEMNSLKSPYSLRVGQQLRVSKDAVVAKSSSSSTPKVTPTVAATKSSTSSSSSKNSFMWPVKGEVVSSFGNKSNGLYNDGMNIAAPKGTDFKATESGVVAYVGNELRGYGTIVLIKHNNNWISAYAHCGSVKVARGDKVNKGQVIGTVGQSGNVTSPQLYFSLRNGREAVDPLKYLDK